MCKFVFLQNCIWKHNGKSKNATSNYKMPPKSQNHKITLSKRTWIQYLAHGLSTFPFPFFSPAVFSCAWKSHALWEMFERSHFLTRSLMWIIPTFSWMLTEAANAVLSHLDRTPLSRIPNKLETEYTVCLRFHVKLKLKSFPFVGCCECYDSLNTHRNSPSVLKKPKYNSQLFVWELICLLGYHLSEGLYIIIIRWLVSNTF